ncbi:tetratricopeptide repeat protein [Trinickia dinghuensis]|uniref:Tetratricopeptide repeat protein n=1 Tax=Trinickia dinghuensis TaxID=2291023 RepID=A0A3D8K3G8_9BURK|nr:tetratricopeptide repeat protein [Trinickia dinghuensis]RDU99404.1 tetratricopeptide repeat protein [Trinickia dinghuensis]
MKTFLAAFGAALLFVSSAAFAAVPTASQVDQAMSQGNWQQADTELSQVLAAHPNNAHAHYLYGQVLAKEGRYADALTQVQQAKTLDPQIRFTSPARFNQVESHIRAEANRTGAAVAPAQSTGTQLAGALPSTPAPVHHRGPSMVAWIVLAIVIVGIVLILRWTLRRARSNEDGRADEERRAQLKRATELLNSARALKLDARLSSAPGHETLAGEVEGVENQLRTLVETLSNNGNPVPAYQLEDLARRIESLRARAEGRPDPNAQTSGAGPSAYAQEAERLQQQQAPYGMQQPYPPQQQAPVIVQQGGGGMDGLLTGVLLGQAMSGRDRVIERDVYIDDDEARRRAAERNDGGNVDLGQGSNDWDDNSGGNGGGVDFGGDDSGGGWSDN